MFCIGNIGTIYYSIDTAIPAINAAIPATRPVAPFDGTTPLSLSTGSTVATGAAPPPAVVAIGIVNVVAAVTV